MFQRILRLFIKELLVSLRDPKSRFVIIGPPIIQLFIFSYAITLDVKNASLAILNHDTGIEAQSVIKNVVSTPVFTKVITVKNEEQIRDALDKQIVSAALVFPPNFSETAAGRSAQPAPIEIIADGRRANASPILVGYLQKMIQADITGRMRERGAAADTGGISVVTRHWFNPNLLPRLAFIPALICILCTVVGTILSGLSVAREREIGTFEQLLVCPLTSFEILVGKTLAVMLLTTVTAAFLALIIIYFFGISLKAPIIYFFLSTEIFLLAVIGVGLFVSSLVTTQQQAVLGCILVLPPSIMLSGFATPIENMPALMQWITVANPVRWFLIVIKGLFLRGMAPEAIFENLWPMLVIAAVTLSAAGFMFKRRRE